MSSITFYLFFIYVLAFVLLAINLTLAPNNPYQEKDSVFECGFHSFLGQNRTQFSISFFVFALLFLLFDLEILLVYPYVVSAYSNGVYGLVFILIFLLALTLGFAFELGKKALNLDTKQSSFNNTILSVKFTLKTILHNISNKGYTLFSSSKATFFNNKEAFYRFFKYLIAGMFHNTTLTSFLRSHFLAVILQDIEDKITKKLLYLMVTNIVVFNVFNFIKTFFDLLLIKVIYL
jgi:NADH-ubiquinone oxidoreductase chain 3